MKFATVRMLKNKTSAMLRLASSGKDVLITSHGRPVAILQGMSEDDLEDYVLSHHPGLRKSIEDAWRHYQKHGGTPLKDVMKKLKERKGKRRAKLRR